MLFTTVHVNTERKTNKVPRYYIFIPSNCAGDIVLSAGNSNAYMLLFELPEADTAK